MKHVMKRITGKTMRHGCFTRMRVSIFRFAIVTCQCVEIKSSGRSHTNSRTKGRVRSKPKKDTEVYNYDTNERTKEAAVKQ